MSKGSMRAIRPEGCGFKPWNRVRLLLLHTSRGKVREICDYEERTRPNPHRVCHKHPTVRFRSSPWVKHPTSLRGEI